MFDDGFFTFLQDFVERVEIPCGGTQHKFITAFPKYQPNKKKPLPEESSGL
jgi:hypothetical protein